MLENGGGYQNVAPTTQGKAELITVDGDGRDSNGDGRPDAKMNSDRIYVDFNRTGGVFH